MFSNLAPHHRDTLGQLVRFLVSGGIVTALGVGVYAVVAVGLHWHPQFGNVLAYLTAASTGYVLHSRWSFRGHGAERTHGTVGKFLTVSLVSYAFNSFWVWLLTAYFQLNPEWPILPMLFVTPLVTFTLNRQWVFK